MKRNHGIFQVFSVFLLFATPLAATAARTTASLEKCILALVVRDIDSQLAETYDEGEGTADALSADCSIRPRTKGGYLAFCSVDIEVQPSRESKYRDTVRCGSLRYNVAEDLKSVELVSGQEECIELVNGVSEF